MSERRRFEYHAVTFLDASGAHTPTPSIDQYLERVNALGAEGWEVYNESRGVVHLKRELPAAERADGNDKR